LHIQISSRDSGSNKRENGWKLRVELNKMNRKGLVKGTIEIPEKQMMFIMKVASQINEKNMAFLINEIEIT
jgi:hypothetical protein